MTDTDALTPQPAAIEVAGQIIAADPSQSVWVGANAGTGKTRVLINRILRLLLSNVPPARILCLTFTKAAAAEMATRLNDKLGEWAVISDEELISDLRSLLGRDPDIKTLQTARRLFAETLDTPGGLKIRTIHSFCESLLGRFPVEANIAPHFSVIDERTALELRFEARNRLMESTVGDDSELGRAFNHMAGLVDEDSFAGVISELDSNRQRLDVMLTQHGGVEGIIDAIRARFELRPGDTHSAILNSTIGLDEGAIARVAGSLAAGSAAEQKRAGTILGWLNSDDRSLDFGDYVSVFLTQKGEAKAERSLITKAVQKEDPGALAVLQAEQDRLMTVQDRLKALATTEATEALLIIGARLSAAYRDLKAARAYLDYDDLILKAGELLADGRAAWVHYKLDGGIDHILVDEAQDTSREQWQVISALAEDFFSGDGAGDDQRVIPRTVFAVGDQKQSIYSFQGADPAEFAHMQSFFAERSEAAERRWQSVELSLSFRSVWTVLNLVDDVFTPPEARDGLVHDEKPIRHLSSRDGQAGLVELWPTVSPEDVSDDNPWDAPVDQLSQKSPVVRLAERIAQTIAGWLASSEILPSTGRPITEGDIMVLVRTRGQFAEEMVRQLKQRNIPVAGSDRMVLLNQMAVMDLIAAGRFSLLPDDDLNTAIVLKSPFIGFDDDDLFALAYKRSGSLWQALREQRANSEKFNRAAGELESLLASADFSPPFEFFSTLLGSSIGRKNLLGRLGPDARDAIDEFVNLCLAYERDHAPSMEGFLDWLEAGETQIKRDLEHGGNQVRVMTVHGAKGLQSNIVFLPDTCSMPSGRQSSKLYWEKQGEAPLLFWPVVKDNEEKIAGALGEIARAEMLQEYRRLLYVALTRAEDRVYVCGWETKKNRTEGCWYDLVENAMSANEKTVTFEHGPDETGLRLSSEQTASPDNLGGHEQTETQITDVPNWALSLPGDEPAPPDPLAPSHQDQDEPAPQSPLIGDNAQRFQRGLLIHKLLENLPVLAEQDRAKAAERYLALPSHNLDRAAREDIANETLRVLSRPELAPLFGPDSQPEVPLVGAIDTHMGKRVISAQLDRLLVTDDQVMIIDYKTNRPPPVDEADVPAPYLKQMAAYRSALRNIYPGKTVRTVLLWTDGPHAMVLNDAHLDAYAP
jgi:ATP-dependent helicase/nuclease subunit A